MRSDWVSGCLVEMQLDAYQAHKAFSKKHQFLGRLCGVPAAMCDVIYDTSVIWSAVEHLAFAAINLVGAAYSNKCTIKDAIFNFEVACMETASFCIKMVLFPIKFLFQVCIILINPVKYRPINYTLAAFKGETILQYQHQSPAHLQIIQQYDFRQA